MMKLHIFAVSALLFTASAPAASITFGAAQTLSGDSDVVTTGTLVQATNWSTNQSVGGVSFTATANASGTGVFALSGMGTVSTNAFDDGNAAPFSNLSTAYKAMLAGGAYKSNTNAGSGTITLSGLTLNQSYLVQFWVLDSRVNTWSPQTLSSSGGNSVSLDFNTTNVAGGLGQFVTGTFTADATSQVINLSCPTNSTIQVNALQLRAVPEPSTYGLLGAGTLAALSFARRRRRR